MPSHTISERRKRKGARLVLSSRVEKAAAQVIGAQEEARESRRQGASMVLFHRRIEAREKAEKALRKSLPGSTGRLRRQVIALVKRRLAVSQILSKRKK